MTSSGWPEYPTATPNGAASPAAPAANVGIAVQPSPPANPMARLRLNTVGDVAKELRKLYREARSNKLATGEATKLAYLLTQLASLMTASQLEERVTKLEGERS